MTQALARAGPRHNYNVELVYRRRTERACRLFQRLALPKRLLLHCAKSATALRLKSSVCQNDSFWRATSGSTGSTEPGTRPGMFLPASSAMAEVFSSFLGTERFNLEIH